MTRMASLFAAIVLLLLEPTGGRVPPERATVAASATDAPLRVRWRGASRQRGRVSVDAVVELRARLAFPLTVRVDVPRGATVVSGRTLLEVPENTEPGELVEHIEVVYAGAAPADDLTLHAVGGAIDVGVHAAVGYGFGRVQVDTQPIRTGDSVQIAGKDLGQAVALDAGP